MILITGAGGKTGQTVVRALASQGQEVRALVRRPELASQLIDMGAVETVVGDLLKQEDVSRASNGIRAIYHICPNVSQNEIHIGEIAIQAGQEAGVERFVYHSVLHPHVEKMPHHWQKMRVEEMLFESHLKYTILQPTAYMQNILASWKAITEDGVYEVPYSLEARSSIVDLLDVAEAVRIVLTEAGHDWAIYELCGPEPLSQVDQAEILSEVLQRPVRSQELRVEVWKERMVELGLGEYAINTLIAMFEYYDAHGFPGNSSVLENLLRRPATDFRTFVRRLASNDS